jgi:ABC-type antimicrobial peptide transport system permease subunit
MRIPLRRGRLLETRDDTTAEPVAVVNEAFVHDNFPDEDPIGRLVRVTVDLGYGSPYFRVVGIVGDVRSRRIGEDPEAQIYVPHGIYGPDNLTVNLRTVPGAAGVIPQVRAVLEDMDPTIPMYRVETIAEAFGRQLAPARFYLVLIGAFAALAALLAAVGLYGVAAYNTSRRTRELGLRLALGAEQTGVLKLVLVQGMLPAMAGLAVGLVAAFFGGRVMSAILFGVEPRDPTIFGATALVLLVVALVATLLPARRASRVDPVVALRLS